MYYGMMTGAYDGDTLKAFPLFSGAKQKPQGTPEQQPGLAVYKDRYTNKQQALRALKLRNGRTCLPK